MGFFSDVESDLSGQTTDAAESSAQVIPAESTDLDSMLDAMEDSSATVEPAPDSMVVTETFFELGDEEVPVAPAGDAMETEDTDDEFLSKLSEALGTTVQDDAPAAEPEPVYEEPAATVEPAPVFEESVAVEESVMPEETYAAPEPEPAPVFESAAPMPQFTAAETRSARITLTRTGIPFFPIRAGRPWR